MFIATAGSSLDTSLDKGPRSLKSRSVSRCVLCILITCLPSSPPALCPVFSFTTLTCFLAFFFCAVILPRTRCSVIAKGLHAFGRQRSIRLFSFPEVLSTYALSLSLNLALISHPDGLSLPVFLPPSASLSFPLSSSTSP